MFGISLQKDFMALKGEKDFYGEIKFVQC